MSVSLRAFAGDRAKRGVLLPHAPVRLRVGSGLVAPKELLGFALYGGLSDRAVPVSGAILVKPDK